MSHKDNLPPHRVSSVYSFDYVVVVVDVVVSLVVPVVHLVVEYDRTKTD